MRVIQRYGFMLFILIAPIYYAVGDPSLRHGQELFYRFWAMALISLWLRNVWLTAFMVLNVSLFFLSGAVVGAEYVTNIFIGLFLFWIARGYVKKHHFEFDLRIVLWVGVATVTWMALQRCGVDPLFLGADGAGNSAPGWHFKDMTGLFGLKAAQGVFLALLIPITATLHVWLAPIFLFPIWVCQSSVAVLAGGCGYLFYTWHQARKVFWIALICLIPITGFYIGAKDFKADPEMFMSRFNVWHSAVRASLARPIGYGPDSYRNLTKQKQFLFFGDERRRHGIGYHIGNDNYDFKYYHADAYKMRHDYEGLKPKSPNRWDNPHNEYIMLFFEYGIIGVFLFFGLLLDMIGRFKDVGKTRELILITSCLIVYAVSSLTQFPLHLARLGYIFPILLGAYYGVTERGQARKSMLSRSPLD